MKKYKKRAFPIDLNRLYSFSNCLSLDRPCPECRYYEACKQHALKFIKLPKEDQDRKIFLKALSYKGKSFSKIYATKHGAYRGSVRDDVIWTCLDVLKPCKECYQYDDCSKFIEKLGYDENAFVKEAAEWARHGRVELGSLLHVSPRPSWCNPRNGFPERSLRS